MSFGSKRSGRAAVIRELQKPYRLDEISREFIHIVCNDPALDHALGRLGGLFAVPLPEPYEGTRGTYWHHDGLRGA